MIEDFQISMECKIIQSIEYEHNDVFISQVMEIYSQPEIISNFQLSQYHPIIFTNFTKDFWSLTHRGKMNGMYKKFEFYHKIENKIDSIKNYFKKENKDQ
jgi:flavin reductase (DIM6/NTAB) family NADH-FMN oxidoreductase RutF